ncbi:MAG: peptidoglycan recognition family protein [Myxococcota bacterium]
MPPPEPPQTLLPAVGVTPWPIQYGPTRMRLTAAYQRAHRGPDAVTGDDDADSRMVPRMIVLHWTASGYARSTWFTFDPERRPRRPDLNDAKALNLSTHFLVDRDGTIYQLMDETRIGRHVIGLNHVAIGVENVGDGQRYPMTDAQVQANVALVQYLVARYESITHLIGHYEYQQFERSAHPYFHDIESKRSQKIDPGAEFMRAVRQKTLISGLEGAPSIDTCDNSSRPSP